LPEANAGAGPLAGRGWPGQQCAEGADRALAGEGEDGGGERVALRRGDPGRVHQHPRLGRDRGIGERVLRIAEGERLLGGRAPVASVTVMPAP